LNCRLGKWEDDERGLKTAEDYSHRQIGNSQV
jgi:hypothetical protein